MVLGCSHCRRHGRRPWAPKGVAGRRMALRDLECRGIAGSGMPWHCMIRGVIATPRSVFLLLVCRCNPLSLFRCLTKLSVADGLWRCRRSTRPQTPRRPQTVPDCLPGCFTCPKSDPVEQLGDRTRHRRLRTVPRRCQHPLRVWHGLPVCRRPTPRPGPCPVRQREREMIASAGEEEETPRYAVSR